MRRIRQVLVAGILALVLGGAAQAVALPALGGPATGENRYGCGGVDAVGGLCIDSPLDTLDTLDGPLDTVGSVLR